MSSTDDGIPGDSTFRLNSLSNVSNVFGINASEKQVKDTNSDRDIILNNNRSELMIECAESSVLDNEHIFNCSSFAGNLM